MVQERELSREKKYQSPVLATIDDTHDTYNACVRLVLEQIDRFGRTWDREAVQFTNGWCSLLFEK